MLKKIAVTDLRMGMHLHALDGAWLDHPFWRNKFLLTDDADLRAVLGSGVRHCWIDASKGLDVAIAAAPVAEPVALAEPMASAPERVPEASTAFEEEMAQAARLCRKSRLAVQQLFAEVRMGKALSAQAFQPLVEELAASVFRNPGALVSLARLKTKDDYSYMHSVAVCALMVALARELGRDAPACREAGLAGLLHDVGKALMPLEVLNKPGKLSEAEFAVMRSHPVRGHELLVEGGTAGAAALDVCLHHHERVDGSGYPHGLKGEAIASVARMGAICDVYDAISSTRAYKAAWDPADSLSRMASWDGHFDPLLFAAFVRSLGIYPTGSLLRLRSGRLAVVVKQGPEEPDGADREGVLLDQVEHADRGHPDRPGPSRRERRDPRARTAGKVELPASRHAVGRRGRGAALSARAGAHGAASASTWMRRSTFILKP
jgi:HD-GYP domain-containing protein (c-di-GMP phosphodiesterase class II)